MGDARCASWSKHHAEKMMAGKAVWQNINHRETNNPSTYNTHIDTHTRI